MAKIHEIGERVEKPDRLSDKDALDVYRLLRVVPTEELVRRFRGLQGSDRSRAATAYAIGRLPQLLGSVRAPGFLMAVRAAGAMASDTLTASLVALTQDLLVGSHFPRAQSGAHLHPRDTESL